MTLFQWLCSGLMSALVLMEVVLQLTGRTRRIISSLRAAVWLLALFLILVPSLTNRIAVILSIGRGADVVLYLTVISFLLSFFYLLHSVESQREQITLLVRRIALQNPVSLQYPAHKDDESKSIPSLSDQSSPSCAQV